MSKNSASPNGEKFKSKIGGQALIEGIMMLGPTTGAMACRLPDGTVDLETWEEKNGKNAPWYKKTPLVRGCTSFILSIKVSKITSDMTLTFPYFLYQMNT